MQTAPDTTAMSDRTPGPEPGLAIDAPEADSDQFVDWVAGRLVRVGRERGRRRRLKLIVIGSLVLLLAAAGTLLSQPEWLERLTQWLGFSW